MALTCIHPRVLRQAGNRKDFLWESYIAFPEPVWGRILRRILKQMRIDDIDELLPEIKDPVTADILTENTQGLKGLPLKASAEQDHMAHIQGHLAFAASPLQLNNPLVPPQAVSGFLAHVEEHIQMYTADVTYQVAQQLRATMVGANDDQIFAVATQQAMAIVTQQLQVVLQQVAPIQQALQQRMPPPQLPPEVQASLQIAQMDTQRKTQYDQGMLQLKGQEMAQKSQGDVAKLQIESQTAAAESQAAQQLEFAQFQAERQDKAFEQQLQAAREQFDQYIRQMAEESRSTIENLKQEVELLKNREDNRTRLEINAQDNSVKSETDLAINNEDNITKMVIAGLTPDMKSE